MSVDDYKLLVSSRALAAHAAWAEGSSKRFASRGTKRESGFAMGNIRRIDLLLLFVFVHRGYPALDQIGCEGFKTSFAKIKTYSICDMHLHSAVKYKMFHSTTNIMSQPSDA